MSKELIESLRYLANHPSYSGAADIMLRAADALEAKAAPVGDLREAFEAWRRSAGLNDGFVNYWSLKAFQAGAAYQRAQQPQAIDWQPSGADYDRSIHMNPDAKAWADFFVATFPGLADKHDLMFGWFANAMMAMHDYLKSQQPQSAEAVVMLELLQEGQCKLVDCEALPAAFKLKPGLHQLYTAPQPSAGVVMPSAEVLADLFVGCPLPKTVRVDQCALDPECPHRFGTNLLTWGEAKLMFDEMFARLNGKEVGRG